MKMRIDIVVFVLMCSMSALAISNIVLATPENWSEVTRFTGAGTAYYTTEDFSCSHAEWRIRWSYTPWQTYPGLTVFNVDAYSKVDNTLVASVFPNSTETRETKSGISYVHNNQGTFYCKINVVVTQDYTVIIEQDLDSIPEFPSFLIMPLFIVITLLAVIIQRRKRFNTI